MGEIFRGGGGGVNEGGIPRKWGIRACCTQASPLIAAHCTLLTSQLTHKQYRLEHLCRHSLPIISLSHQACVNSLTIPVLHLTDPLCFIYPVSVGSHQNMLMIPNSTIMSLKSCAPSDLHLTAPFTLFIGHGISHIMIPRDFPSINFGDPSPLKK